MRTYKESEIFVKMNKGNAIINQIGLSLKDIDSNAILNEFLRPSLVAMKGAYKDTISDRVIEAVSKGDLLVCNFRLDKRFPANMPYVRLKRNGRPCVVIDMSKYVTLETDSSGKVIGVTCDTTRLYSMLVPALVSLKVLNEENSLPLETIKMMSMMWALMFNRVLKSQRIFLASEDRYEAFMYLAMKFFMSYYVGIPDILIDKVTNEYLKDGKSPYILFIEENVKKRGIDMYADWHTFASTIFSNDITNIKAATGGTEMNTETYIRLFSTYMGRDGAYISLWSIDYFFFCLFSTYNKSYILNDRNWEDIVRYNNTMMPRLLSSIYKQV